MGQKFHLIFSPATKTTDRSVSVHRDRSDDVHPDVPVRFLSCKICVTNQGMSLSIPDFLRRLAGQSSERSVTSGATG